MNLEPPFNYLVEALTTNLSKKELEDFTQNLKQSKPSEPFYSDISKIVQALEKVKEN